MFVSGNEESEKKTLFIKIAAGMLLMFGGNAACTR
jgi:hypothetical protein